MNFFEQLLWVETSQFVQLIFDDDDDVVPEVLVLVQIDVSENMKISKNKKLNILIYIDIWKTMLLQNWFTFCALIAHNFTKRTIKFYFSISLLLQITC